MKKNLFRLGIWLCLVLVAVPLYAQDEELDVEDSAEVFLEDYSDEFQENFFEALKQKGIENYDKAINLLLECKRLDPNSIVVDHELARAYLKDKQYVLAKQYSIRVLNAQPENEWYLQTLVEIAQKQGNTLLEIQTLDAFANDKLKENLTRIYFKQGKYKQAQEVLKDVKNIPFAQEYNRKISDSIQKLEARKTNTTVQTTTVVVDNSNTNPLDQYKTRIVGCIKNDNTGLLDALSEEALERYPAQPYFYYARGYFFNKKTKHKEAIPVLESALDYLIDDVALANKIYTELGLAYKAIGNVAKANSYLGKVKPGF